MDAKRSQLEETLKRVGFQKDARHMDRLSLQILPNPVPNGEKAYPWELKVWTLGRSSGAWYTEKLSVELNRESFLKSFDELARASLPAVEILEIEDDMSGYWVLFEFRSAQQASQDKAQNQPAYEQGVFGFHVSLLIENQRISVNFSNHFAFGAQDLQVYSESSKLVATALGFTPSKWQRSLFDIGMDLKELVLECSAVRSNRQIFQRLFERFNPRRQFKSGFQAESGWRIFLSTPGVTEFGQVLPPIEVMESRELAQKFQSIESAATQGKYGEARQRLLKGMADYPDSLYLLRRFAYISLLEGQTVSQSILHSMLKAEAKNLLFLSTALHVAREKAESDQVLPRISAMGEVLSERMVRFEEIKVFELVMPEILGDAWSKVDPQRAYLCFERILERRGDSPRILKKMVELTKKRGDNAAEASLVKRLLKLVQDRSELASHLTRLAQLLEGGNLNEAISYAMKAWQMAPHRHVTAEYASGLLLRASNPEKAITVLDETIRQVQNTKNKRKLAELELKVGEIWWAHLNRKDLAGERFKRAYDLHSHDIDFLHLLVAAYRSMKERLHEVRVYERIFDLAIKKQSKDEVFKSVVVLVDYYQKERPDPHRLSVIYQQLVRYYLNNPEELFAIIDIENIDVDWQQLFRSVEKQVDSDHKLDARKYFLLLGRIAVQKLGDRDLGTKYYERCLDVGVSESFVYDYLDDYYSKRKDYKNRVRILKMQIKGVHGAERVELLRQLFYTTEILGSQEVDFYALRILIEAQDQEAIKRRFTQYQSENQLTLINRLISSLLDAIKDRTQKIYWLEYALEVMHECDLASRFETIQKYLQLLEVVHEDEIQVYERAIRYHKDNPDSKPLAVYLDRLITRGVYPDIDPQIVIRSLSDDKPSKGLYLMHLARSQENEMNRFHNLQKALTILKKFDQYCSTVVEVYSELAEINLLQLAELRDFSEYCQKSDKLAVFTQALVGQLKKIPSGTLDLELFNFVLIFLKNHHFEAELIVPVLMMEIEGHELELRERLKLEIFQTLPQKSQYFDVSFGFDFLQEAENWDFSTRFKNMFSWLFSKDESKHRLVDMSHDMIRNFAESGDKKKLARLVEFFKQHGITSRQGSWVAFEYYVSQGVIQKSYEQWFEMLRLVRDPQDLAGLLAETKLFLNGLNSSTQIDELLAYVFDEQLDDQIDQEVRKELKLEYALSLFMSEKHPEISYEILSEQFRRNKEDPRSWIPLFFLQPMLENYYEQYDLLKFIIPKVARDNEILRSYPVTLESLEKGFQKVAGQLGLPEEIPFYVKEAEYMQGNVSDTERNLKAQSFHAASRGENTELNLRFDDESLSKVIPLHEIQKSAYDRHEDTVINELKSVAGEPVFPERNEPTSVSLPPVPSPAQPISLSEVLQQTGVGSPVVHQPKLVKTDLNWRLIGASILAESGSTSSLLQKDFQNQLEKHFAIQLVALIEGQIPMLNSWKHKVWRDYSSYFYQPDQRIQAGEGIVLHHLKQPLAHILLAIRRVLDNAFSYRYTLRGLAETFDIKIDEFIRLRKQLSFDEPILLNSPFEFYQNQWNQKSYRIFDLPGIGRKIYFEFQQKGFYLDLQAHNELPPHYLVHKLIQVSKSVDKGTHKIIRLSPENDLLPIFEQLLEHLEREGNLSHARLILGPEELDLSILSAVDLASLEHDLKSLRGVGQADLQNVLDDFLCQSMLDCLFETLDLIGIVESHMETDLTKDDAARQSVLGDRVIRNLLVHSSKFNF